MKSLVGHPEIDKQHAQLQQIISGLEHVCAQQESTGTPCTRCSPLSFQTCNDRLARLISDLLGGMLDHFIYEEKLMRQLPDNAACRRHIDGHQQAHAEISRLLSELTLHLDRGNPRQSSLQLLHIANAWMGGHSEHYDSALAVSLDGAYGVEIGYDLELGRLLENNS